jgi:holo-[acyl-carrier protein] synthase
MIGIDLVQTSRIRESLAHFGERFVRRVFTEGEAAYARSVPELMPSRLAARLAAKEATIKALDLAERGVGWREIEVIRGPTGAPALVLHGAARAAAEERGAAELAVSLSHEGDYATAVVVSMPHGAPRRRRRQPTERKGP